jgi:RPEL repeat
MRADSLNEKIAHRPKPEELIKEGILERAYPAPNFTDFIANHMGHSRRRSNQDRMNTSRTNELAGAYTSPIGYKISHRVKWKGNQMLLK